MSLSRDARQALTAPASQLSVALEFWLCDLFRDLEVTRAGEIWCDGIVELAIEQLHRRAFLLSGVGWFPDWMSPFEVEMHFSRRRALQPQHSVLRFGERDRHGEIRRDAKPQSTQMMLAERPRSDRDWAVTKVWAK